MKTLHFCGGLFCRGLFCRGLFCRGLFCRGLFCRGLAALLSLVCLRPANPRIGSRSRRRHLLQLATVALAALQILSEPSLAEPNVLTEVVVEGANIPDPLEALPSSATVIRTAEAAERGADHFQDIIDQVPNLTWAGGTSRPTFFQIRGIGEVEQYEGAPNPSVGFLIDDIDFSSIGGVASLFDIDQVEVMRGPQAIRYGANALAGVVHLRSTDPTPELSGILTGGFGSNGLATAGAAVGGPVSSDYTALRFRLSAFQHVSNGFRDNLFLGQQDTNERNESTARLKLQYRPDSSFGVDLTMLALDFDNGYDAFSIDNSLNTQSDRPGVDAQETGAFALSIRGAVSEHVEARMLTSGAQAMLDYSFDGDWGNNSFWQPFDPYDFFSSTDRARRTISQELRLSSPEARYRHGETTRWTTGVFLQRFSEATEIRNAADGIIFDTLDSRYVASTGAVFGEYEIPIFSRTAFRLGLRGEQRETTYRDNRGNTEGPDDQMWGGAISIDHEASDEVRLYSSLSRGFKGGGVNVSLNVPQEKRTFSPESLYSIESGIKGSWLDDTLTWNNAVFYALRRDIQTESSFQSDPQDPLTFIYLTDNAARGWNIGLESELTYRPTSQWRVRLSGSLLDTEYSSVDEPVRLLEGRAQASAPRWQYASSVRHYFDDYFFAELSLSGKAPFYYQDSNNQRASAYHLLGATLGFESEHVTVTLWGRNLTDADYAVRGFFFGNEPPDFQAKEYIQRGDPLQAGVTLTVRF